MKARAKKTAYYVYLLRCRDNTLYCGLTNDLKRRLAEHSAGKTKSARYTRTRGPVKLVHAETHESLALAMKRERHIKTWKKEKKEELVRLFGARHHKPVPVNRNAKPRTKVKQKVG